MLIVQQFVFFKWQLTISDILFYEFPWRQHWHHFLSVVLERGSLSLDLLQVKTFVVNWKNSSKVLVFHGIQLSPFILRRICSNVFRYVWVFADPQHWNSLICKCLNHFESSAYNQQQLMIMHINMFSCLTISKKQKNPDRFVTKVVN